MQKERIKEDQRDRESAKEKNQKRKRNRVCFTPQLEAEISRSATRYLTILARCDS